LRKRITPNTASSPKATSMLPATTVIMIAMISGSTTSEAVKVRE